MIWEMFMVATMNAATFMGKISWIMKIPSWIPQISHWRECSTYLQDWWANKIRSSMWVRFIGEEIHGNNCLLIGDETVINLQRTKVYVFSDSVLCLGKVHQHPESNEAWKKRIEWIINEKSYRDWRNHWRADWIRVEHLPRIHYVAALR